MKPWQRGYDLDLLRELASMFQDHDGARCLGAFSKIKENKVADWLAAGVLERSGDTVVVSKRLRQKQTIRDFRGVPILSAEAGTVIVEKAVGPDAFRMIDDRHGTSPIVWKCWTDHPDETAVAERLGALRAGTSISAASEVRAVWARDLPVLDRPSAIETANICLATLPAIDTTGWEKHVDEMWQDHYSAYNKRRSWHAVSLRSFGGQPWAIEKPAEMSRRWKQEHPELTAAPCVDTPLLPELPNAAAWLNALPTETERVRLMRLTPGGELSRHADITDRNAGLTDGRIARMHWPISSDPLVTFDTWDLSNTRTTTHMSPGSWWYLDVRKPHAAHNRSSRSRVHLVVDLVVNGWVRDALHVG